MIINYLYGYETLRRTSGKDFLQRSWKPSSITAASFCSAPHICWIRAQKSRFLFRFQLQSAPGYKSSFPVFRASGETRDSDSWPVGAPRKCANVWNARADGRLTAVNLHLNDQSCCMEITSLVIHAGGRVEEVTRVRVRQLQLVTTADAWCTRSKLNGHVLILRSCTWSLYWALWECSTSVPGRSNWGKNTFCVFFF